MNNRAMLFQVYKRAMVALFVVYLRPFHKRTEKAA
jgi:hypothetical protein